MSVLEAVGPVAGVASGAVGAVIVVRAMMLKEFARAKRESEELGRLSVVAPVRRERPPFVPDPSDWLWNNVVGIPIAKWIAADTVPKLNALIEKRDTVGFFNGWPKDDGKDVIKPRSRRTAVVKHASA